MVENGESTNNVAARQEDRSHERKEKEQGKYVGLGKVSE